MTQKPASSPTVDSFPRPPRGLKAIPWRLPIALYRLGLGGLMGNTFLLLTHTGRKSGLPRQAVLEIIQASPAESKFLVVSGFGTRSNWYRNILQDPLVEIQVGNQRIKATARQLEPDEAGEAIVAYAQKHPGNLKALSRLLGYEIDHSPAGYRAFGAQIPVIEFQPRHSSPRPGPATLEA